MARGSGKKDDLVKCEYCGEFYSTTYKHCPFCNEDGTGGWDEPDEEEYDDRPRRPAGGKRLQGGMAAGGGRDRRPAPRINPMSVVGVILSLILIIAAVCIVVSIFRSIVGPKQPKPTPTPPSIESTEPTPTPTPSEPAESETPSVEPTTPSVDIVTPTSFTINKSDISFFGPGEICDLKLTPVPANATLDGVTWKSSNADVASVSWSGRVTAISRGTVTITATIEGVGEQSCIVRCQFDGTASSSSSGSSGSNQSSSGGLTLSRSDFTLASVGDSWTLVVSGTDSPVTWSSSNTDVATVSDKGKVVAVSKGTCTVTAEVDGVKLKCIVRCNW